MNLGLMGLEDKRLLLMDLRKIGMMRFQKGRMLMGLKIFDMGEV
jgi:hypothetical protein